MSKKAEPEDFGPKEWMDRLQLLACGLSPEEREQAKRLQEELEKRDDLAEIARAMLLLGRER